MVEVLNKFAVAARPRKRRAQTDEEKLAEPLRIVPGFDRRRNPIWKILGWITPTLQCKRECRRGTEAMRKEAERIKEEEEFRRVQLQSGETKQRASQWTWLTKPQIEEAQTAYSHMEKAGRTDPVDLVDHVDYALERKVDARNSKLLADAIDCMIAERKKLLRRGQIRKRSFFSFERYLKQLKTLYPKVTVHEFAFEKITPPPPQPPIAPYRAYEGLLGISSWTVRRLKREGAPLPRIIFVDGQAAWDPQGIAKLQEWLPEHHRSVKIAIPVPPPPIGAPADSDNNPQSRVANFCELLSQCSNRGRRLGEGVSLQTMENRRIAVMCFLQYCVAQEWIERLPAFPPYKPGSKRLRGKAPSLTVEQCELYLRWFEEHSREHVFREVLKLMGHLRSQEETKRFDAWINPATQFALPQAADWKFRPTPAHLEFWTTFRQIELSDKCHIEAAGKLRVDATVSKIHKERIIYLTPNAALWLAVYQSEWRMGEWAPDSAAARFETFDQYVDHCYNIHRSRPHRDLRKIVPLTPNILRHSNITYFVVRFDSILSAAKQSGNSPDIIDLEYLDSGRTLEDGKQFYAILPKGWRWASDGKSFVPPADWKRPPGWKLPIAER